jgi:hypothetical protein
VIYSPRVSSCVVRLCAFLFLAILLADLASAASVPAGNGTLSWVITPMSTTGSCHDGSGHLHTYQRTTWHNFVYTDPFGNNITSAAVVNAGIPNTGNGDCRGPSPSSVGLSNAFVSIIFNTLTQKATQGFGTTGSVFPKYEVLGVIYAPPGQQSSVNYGSSTALGTDNSWSNSFSSGTKLDVSFKGQIPLLGGANGMTSQSWTQTAETSGSITVNKSTGFNIIVPGPADSNLGIDHDADVILLWLNPQSSFTATSSNSATWHHSFDQRDINEADVVPVPVAFLKNPSTMPPGLQASLQRTWAGSGQGLTANDFAVILARDPFASGATTIDNTRFDLVGGQTFSYLPPACGITQPNTETFKATYDLTSTLGQSAMDEFDISYTRSGTASFLTWFSANWTSTSTFKRINKWGHQNMSGAGNSAMLTITGPTDCHYSGKTNVQIYQDNVYGTFMFAFF